MRGVTERISCSLVIYAYCTRTATDAGCHSAFSWSASAVCFLTQTNSCYPRRKCGQLRLFVLRCYTPWFLLFSGAAWLLNDEIWRCRNKQSRSTDNHWQPCRSYFLLSNLNCRKHMRILLCRNYFVIFFHFTYRCGFLGKLVSRGEKLAHSATPSISL